MADNKEYEQSSTKLDITVSNLHEAQDWIRKIAETSTSMEKTISFTVKIKNTPAIQMEVSPGHQDIEALITGHKSRLDSLSPGMYATGAVTASSPSTEQKLVR